MTENKSASNIIKLVSMIAIIAMVLVSVLVYHASVAGLILFLLFIVCYVNLPGLLLAKILKADTGHISGNLLISLFAGWALIVGEFFISALIDNNIILYSVGPILSILYLYYAYKDRESLSIRRFKLSAIPASLMIAAALVLLYILLRTQYLYMAPDMCESVFASTDKAYQMGLINSLANDYPLVNPWMSGRTVHYHIFSQILYAVFIKIFGLTSDFVILSCGPYLTAYTLTLSFYALFRFFSGRNKNAGLYTLAIVLSNMFIAGSLSSSYLFRILFVNDNFGGYGVAAAIAWIIMFGVYCRTSEDGATRIKQIIMLILLIMLTTGIKAPIAIVIVGGLIGTFLLGLIMRKLPIKEALPLAAITLGFLLIYKTVLSSSGSSGVGGQSIFGFAKLNGLCFWKAPLIESLTAHSVPPIMRLGIVMALFMICYLSAFLVPFCIGYVREFVLVIRAKKEFDYARITIYASALVGLVMSLILRYSGHSQIYFMAPLIGFVPLIAFWFFEDVALGESAHWMEVLASIAKVLFVVTLVATSIGFICGNIDQISDARKHADTSRNWGNYRSMNDDEYDAMNWIRENTEEDALIATHMHANVKPENYNYQNRWVNCHFLYAAYSDRYYYIEGSGFSLGDDEWPIRKDLIETNAELYDANNPERGDLARRLGIDYIVVTRHALDVPDLSNEDYELCYSNDDVDIYKVAA